MTPYRDGLRAARDALEQAYRSVRERARQLTHRDRRRLPRRLRRELLELETSLAQPARCLDDVASAERVLDEYDCAVGAALEVTSERQSYLVRVRTARRKLAAVATAGLAGALAIPAVPTAGHYWHAVERCADSYWCETEGRCHASLSAALVGAYPDAERCVARSAVDCAASCAEYGNCTVVDGECQARAGADCRASKGCRDCGACSLQDGQCGPSSHGDCAQSGLCSRSGRCHWDTELGCVATSDVECQSSLACAQDGACAAHESRCVKPAKRDAAQAAQRCRESTECRLSGLCTHHAGTCVAASDSDCGFSTNCEYEGHCRAHANRCVALQDEDCWESYACEVQKRCTADEHRCVVKPPTP